MYERVDRTSKKDGFGWNMEIFWSMVSWDHCILDLYAGEHGWKEVANLIVAEKQQKRKVCREEEKV